MSPTAFSVKRLGLIPYEWQAESLESVAMGQFSSIVAANGSGKTDRLVAPLILWFLDTYPKGKAVFTSGSYRQLANQLWPALKKHRAKFPAWTFLSDEIRTPEGGFALGFSTDDPGRAEGWHGSADAPLLLIVDEAKTVPDGVFEAFDRCTRTFQLWTSSPGAPRGQFFDSHHKNAGQFWTAKVTSEECPHIDPAKRERDRQTYGADHPIFRSMHLAEFTSDSDRLVIDPQRLAKAIEGQPDINTTGEVVAFCDFAAGRDENVLAIRRGNLVEIVEAWVEADTTQACRRFVHLFEEHKLRPAWIWGDADGLGTVMLDNLAEAGWRVNRFHGGQPATDSEEYASLIAEVWHVGIREIERGRIHLGQLDRKTFEQISSRRSEWAANGKLRVESKESMAKQGLRSPDRADALLGSIACGSRIAGTMTGNVKTLTRRNAFASKRVRGLGSV